MPPRQYEAAAVDGWSLYLPETFGRSNLFLSFFNEKQWRFTKNNIGDNKNIYLEFKILALNISVPVKLRHSKIFGQF